MPSEEWTVSTMSRGPVHHARLATTKSRARSAKRWRRDQRVAPTGASGAWLKRSVMRLRRCIGSGAPSVCSRTASRLSSSPPIRCLWRKYAISSGSTGRHPNAQSCCVSMRKARCRRSTARNRCSRCGQGRSSGARTITSGMGRHRCSRRSMSKPAPSSASAWPATARASSAIPGRDRA